MPSGVNELPLKCKHGNLPIQFVADGSPPPNKKSVRSAAKKMLSSCRRWGSLFQTAHNPNKLLEHGKSRGLDADKSLCFAENPFTHTGRVTRRARKLERFSFDVGDVQCEHSY